MAGPAKTPELTMNPDALRALAKRVEEDGEARPRQLQELDWIQFSSWPDSKIQEASCIFIDAGRHAAAEFLRIVLVPRVQDLLLAKDPEISIELCHTLRAYPSDEFCSQVVVPLTTDGINFPKAGPATADLLADKLIPFVSTAPEDISRAVTKICERRLSDNQSLRSVPSRFESTNKIVTALLQKLPKGHAEANFDLCNWLERYCHDASLQMPWYATADKMPDFYGLSFTW